MKKKAYARILLISVINFVVAGVYIGLLNAFGAIENVYSEPLLFVFVGGGFSAFMIGAVLLVYKFVDKKPLHTLGFSFKKRDLSFSLIGSVVILLCYGLFMVGLENANLLSIEVNEDYVKSFGYLTIFPFLLGWMLGALHEEITNRAYFFQNLQHFRMVKLLIVSSFIFAILHFFKDLNPIYFVILFSSGISFMYIYVKCGTVWVGTIIHAFMNFADDFFFNEQANSNLSLFYLTNIQEEKTYLLYLVFTIGLNVLLIVLVHIFYKEKNRDGGTGTLSHH